MLTSPVGQNPFLRRGAPGSIGHASPEPEGDYDAGRLDSVIRPPREVSRWSVHCLRVGTRAAALWCVRAAKTRKSALCYLRRRKVIEALLARRCQGAREDRTRVGMAFCCACR